MQVPEPVHAPDQPVNTLVDVGVAVRVTDIPDANGALQVVPQLMPVGLDVTVPEPVPDRVTASMKRGWNVALTDWSADIDTVQVALVPVQAPDQPVKTLVEDG